MSLKMKIVYTRVSFSLCGFMSVTMERVCLKLLTIILIIIIIVNVTLYGFTCLQNNDIVFYCNVHCSICVCIIYTVIVHINYVLFMICATHSFMSVK